MPQQDPRSTQTGLHFLAGLLTALTFVADLSLPPGVVSGMPYAVLVLLGLRARSPRFTWVGALIATGLTIAGAHFTNNPNPPWAILVDRGVTIVVIWSIAVVVLRQKRTEVALRSERLESQRYLDVAEVAMVLLDRNGRVEMINRKGCEIMRGTSEQIVGRDWFASFIPESARRGTRAAFEALMRGRAEENQSFENPVLTVDGEERFLAWRNAYMRDKKGEIIGTLSSGVDVTERMKAQESLAQYHKELADLKSALDQAAIVAATDERGVINYVNDKFCEISRYSREELLGQDHRIINSGFHPPEFFRGLWSTIGAGEIWRGEVRNRAKDDSLYWVDTTIVPFLDESGKPYRYLAIRSDITDRKQAEVELRRQESLAQLGGMAAQVAHEVKNPLAGISGALQIIRKRVPMEEGDEAVIREILARIDALNEWIQELLVFARPRSPRFEPVRVQALLEETVTLMREDPIFHKVRTELEGDDMTLSGDAELLKGVFHNLLLNAAQAMNGEGAVRVRLDSIHGMCRIVFGDDGPGIPFKTRKRVFEPFFTTRTQGSGLGLAVAKQVVEAHGGEIDAVCPESGGTRVTILLPGEQHRTIEAATAAGKKGRGEDD